MRVFLPITLLSLFGFGHCLTETYDYILVGGGTCGLVLANRLSQNAAVSVAVVDPGSDQSKNPLVRAPAPSMPLFESLVTNWDYRTTPQIHGRVLDIHSGKGLGGSSLINAMAYVRGDKAQFDAWEELGNPGWNWEELQPYYKSIEKLMAPKPWQTELGASVQPENHGFDGNLHVGFSFGTENRSFYGNVSKSWANLGFSHNDDVNSGSTNGTAIAPQTIDVDLHQRWDSATAFLSPIIHRPNLHLINGTVKRIVWSGSDNSNNEKPEASGVELITPDTKLRTIHATQEVILSAGTFRTPLILERSGVGNANLLKRLGITPIVDLPGVGENLVDQPNILVMFHARDSWNGGSPVVSFATARTLFGDDFSHIANETWQGIGRLAQKIAREATPGSPDAAARERLLRLQYELVFARNVTVTEIFTSSYAGKVVTSAAHLQPFSRGSIHIINNTNTLAADLPEIDPKYLSVLYDQKTQASAARLAARLSKTPPLSDVATSELLAPSDDSSPPPSLDANESVWRSWSASAVSSNWHSIGTAAMMAREPGVVLDPHLRVYGTARLRVVDAAMVPLQMSGHPMATLYAIAERAAEWIKSDAAIHSGNAYERTRERLHGGDWQQQPLLHQMEVERN